MESINLSFSLCVLCALCVFVRNIQEIKHER